MWKSYGVFVRRVFRVDIGDPRCQVVTKGVSFKKWSNDDWMIFFGNPDFKGNLHVLVINSWSSEHNMMPVLDTWNQKVLYWMVQTIASTVMFLQQNHFHQTANPQFFLVNSIRISTIRPAIHRDTRVNSTRCGKPPSVAAWGWMAYGHWNPLGTQWSYNGYL